MLVAAKLQQQNSCNLIAASHKPGDISTKKKKCFKQSYNRQAHSLKLAAHSLKLLYSPDLGVDQGKFF
jgi:hypothetical protein